MSACATLIAQTIVSIILAFSRSVSALLVKEYLKRFSRSSVKKTVQSPTQPTANASACNDNDPEKEVAQARMDALLPHAQACMAGNRLPSRKVLEPIEEKLHIHVSTMYRQIEYAVKVGCNVTWSDFKKRQSSGGRGGTSLEDIEHAELKCAIDHVYFDLKLRPGQKGITNAIEGYILKRGNLHKDDIPSPKTIAKWTKHYADRYDEQFKQKRSLSPRPLGPVMDAVAMDWTERNSNSKESLVVLTDEDEVIGVANLVCGVEEVTLLPWGWLWCVGSPTPDLLPECVFWGTLTKRTLSEKYNLTHRASAAGKPRAISFAANRTPPSSIVRQLADSAIGIATEQREISNPRLDGIANDLYGRFLEFLDEQSKIALQLKKLSYQCQGSAHGQKCIRWSDLEEQWVTWCFHYYIIQETTRLGGYAPATCFENLVKPKTLPAECGEALVDRPEYRYRYLQEERRVFNQHGIEIHNRFYSTESLKREFYEAGRSSRKKRSVWVSKIDLTEVYVRNPEIEKRSATAGEPENTASIIAVPARRPTKGDLIDCTEWEWALRWKNSRGPNNPTEPLPEATETTSPEKKAPTEVSPSASSPPTSPTETPLEPPAPHVPPPRPPQAPEPALNASSSEAVNTSDIPRGKPNLVRPPSVPFRILDMRKRRNRL